MSGGLRDYLLIEMDQIQKHAFLRQGTFRIYLHLNFWQRRDRLRANRNGVSGIHGMGGRDRHPYQPAKQLTRNSQNHSQKEFLLMIKTCHLT